MFRGLRRGCALAAAWWIERNPTYLLSAAAMAVGAKLFLFAPDARAGEIGLILLTLGVLQAYELAASTILVVLHRLRRSPEDQPSLLLVAGLFWTGPLAATLELSERDGALGAGFAAAACLIALSELWAVRRAIGLRISPAAQLAACLCVGLVAAAPLRLRVPYGEAGTDELTLYGCWWLLGALALSALPGLRWQLRRSREAVRVEAAFLVLVVCAAATHLYAMNYAFFGHARAFYVAPLLAALAVVLFEALARFQIRDRRALLACAVLPVIGVGLATQGFDSSVPVDQLPAAFRDPVFTTLFIAAAAWWFGCLRCGNASLLHAGSAAAVLAAFRLLPGFEPVGVESSSIPIGGPPFPLHFALAAYAVAGYLLATGWLRRSRSEFLAALAVHAAAVCLLVIGRTEADGLIIAATIGWSWLIATHVARTRITWPGSLAPITLLIATACVFEFDDSLRWAARLHGASVIVILITAGWRRPWTRYRLTGSLAGSSWLVVCAGRAVAAGPNALAALVVCAAFVLLTAGAAISLHKHRLRAIAQVHCSQSSGTRLEV